MSEMSNLNVSQPRVFATCVNCYKFGLYVGRWVPIVNLKGISLVWLHGSDALLAGCKDILITDVDGIPLRGMLSQAEVLEWAGERGIV